MILAASEDYFEQGNRAFPDDDLLRYNLGQVYFFEKKYDRAETVWGASPIRLTIPPCCTFAPSMPTAGANRPGRNASFGGPWRSMTGRISMHFSANCSIAGETAKEPPASSGPSSTANPDLADARLDLALCVKSGR